MDFQKTDGGAKNAGFKEKRDCTVRAVAVCLELSYADAHAIMASLGRKEKDGFTFRSKTVGDRLGLELRPELGCLRLETVLPELQQGRFIVRVGRHVFAVVNGQVRDTYPPNLNNRTEAVYQLI